MTTTIHDEYIQAGEEPEIIPAINGVAIDTTGYSGLSEVIESLVRGSHVVSVIAFAFDGSDIDSVYFQIQLWSLPDWTTIDGLGQNHGALVSTFWTLDIDVALEIHARTALHIISQHDLNI